MTIKHLEEFGLEPIEGVNILCSGGLCRFPVYAQSGGLASYSISYLVKGDLRAIDDLGLNDGEVKSTPDGLAQYMSVRTEARDHDWLDKINKAAKVLQAA